MKTLYEAPNAVEAHMILNLLEQQGLEGRIDGEYLLGGVGDLPAIGLVRVMVAEEDYPAAKAVIDAWDASQPKSMSTAESCALANKTNLFIAGLVVGLLGAYGYYRAPVDVRGIDYNGDSIADMKWLYSSSGMLVKYEADRNRDGKIDYVLNHDYRGWPDTAKADDNFDGYFETNIQYQTGEIATQEVDTDNDGVADLRFNYTNGVLSTTDYLATKTGRASKIEYYTLGKLTHAERDTDGDGKLDTRTNYDALGEISSVKLIVPQSN